MLYITEWSNFPCSGKEKFSHFMLKNPYCYLISLIFLNLSGGSFTPLHYTKKIFFHQIVDTFNLVIPGLKNLREFPFLKDDYIHFFPDNF